MCEKMIIWVSFENKQHRTNKIIFLDRDGVINRDSPNYVKNLQEFEVFPDVPEALKLVHYKGFDIVIVSNQSGLGRGLIKSEDFWAIHFHMVNYIKSLGCCIRAAFYCPHRPDELCECRKPRPGMLMEAADMFQVNLKDSFFIGDKLTDMEAADEAGCKGILVVRNSESYYGETKHSTAFNLKDAVSIVCEKI